MSKCDGTTICGHRYDADGCTACLGLLCECGEEACIIGTAQCRDCDIETQCAIVEEQWKDRGGVAGALADLLKRSNALGLPPDFVEGSHLGANAAKVALEATQGHAFNACYICVRLRLESRHQSADEKCHRCSKRVCSALHCEESYPDGLPICTVCEGST